MIIGGSDIDNEKKYSWRLAVLTSVVLGVFIAFTDTLGILPYEMVKESVFWFLLKPLAPKICIIIAAYWLIRLLLYPLRSLLKLDARSLSLALAVFMFAFYRLYTFHVRIQFGSFPADMRKPIVLSGLALTVVVFAAASYFLIKFPFIIQTQY